MDKKYLKNVGIYLLTALISIAFIWYMIYQATGGFDTGVETLPAYPSSERSYLTLEAYVMREETILYSGAEGVVNSLYNDGEKVKINSTVAQVYEGISSSTASEIMAIDDRISILEASDISQSVLQSDTATLDTNIAALLDTMRYKLEVGDLDYALQQSDELLTMLNRRTVILSAKSTTYGDLIESLEAEKSQLTGSASSGGSRDVITPISGYYYSDVDGYEDIFSSTRITNLTLDDFEKMKNSQPEQSLLRNTQGVASCKIVTDFKWYVACEIHREQLKSFGEGYSYNVVFPYSGDVELTMKLERILSQSEDERVVLFFSSGSVIDGFNFLRRQTIEIVDAEYAGYRVPVSAVRVVNGKQGVYTLNGNVISFKEIVPLAEFNGYFIVEEQDERNDELYFNKLALYDLIVTKGKNLYDGKIVD